MAAKGPDGEDSASAFLNLDAVLVFVPGENFSLSLGAALL